MELFTLGRDYKKQEIVDEFTSVIWTERYYGDGDFEINLPADSSLISKLPKGQLMMCDDSVEPMILETRDTKDGIFKATGIAIPQWLNNRLVRLSQYHNVRESIVVGKKPGEVIAYLVEQMCIDGPYLDGTNPIGIDVSELEKFPIPGFIISEDSDNTGIATDFTVSYGGLYDAIKQIAEIYEIGMQIIRIISGSPLLSFLAYKGIDRTSDQEINPVIQFSPDMDTFSNITDLESIAEHKNLIYVFAPSAPLGAITDPGIADTVPEDASGFDIRVLQDFSDDATYDDPTTLKNALDQKAADDARKFKIVQLVDGEIVQTGQIVYGEHYFLGDIVEVEGNSGIIQKARITEYIRSQDSAGERAYPGLTMIE